MKAVIIHYLLKNSDAGQKTKIQRMLYGYKDHSNRGKYSYVRKGLVAQIPHLKLDSRMIILSDKDKDKIIFLLEKNKAIVKIIPIEINKSFLI